MASATPDLRLPSHAQSITESVMHGQCNARPMITFPRTEHHRLLAGTKLLLDRGTWVWTTFA